MAETFGQRLKEARLKRGMTMDKLAKCSGITREAISHYENDKCGPTLYSATCLADALGVSLDWLTGRDDRGGILESTQKVLERNDPFTIEEMHREMDAGDFAGLHIWIKDHECPSFPFAGIIDRYCGKIVGIMGANWEKCFFIEEDYGKTWTAYRHKPGEGQA